MLGQDRPGYVRLGHVSPECLVSIVSDLLGKVCSDKSRLGHIMSR
jgi:hypothetical protein